MQRTKGRQRAVCLTESALDLLRTEVHAAWERDPVNPRYTREERARLLGVSGVTAEKILRGEGVDRATLTLAFKSLGIPWQDAYCNRPIPEKQTPEAAPADRAVRPRVTWAAVTVVAVLAALFMSVAGRTSDEATPVMLAFRKELATGSHLYHAGDYRLAQEHIEKALTLARKELSAGALASVIRIAADLDTVVGEFDRAETRYREALSIWRLLERPVCEPALLEALGALEVRRGNPEAARQHFLECLEKYRAFEDQTGITMAYIGLASACLRESQFDSAHAWVQAAQQTLRTLEKPDLEVVARSQAALIESARGRHDAAYRGLNACLSFWQSKKHLRWVATTRLQLAEVHFAAGEFDSARRLAIASKEDFERIGDSPSARDCLRFIERPES